MNMGDNMEAIPTPIPARNLDVMNQDREVAIPMHMDETKKMDAEAKSPGFRPYLSATLPAITHPTMQPRASEPVVNPSQNASSPNWSLRKGNPPVITAKSNPKRYPPIAVTKDVINKKRQLYFRFSTIIAFHKTNIIFVLSHHFFNNK
jgi:hypothetical protein